MDLPEQALTESEDLRFPVGIVGLISQERDIPGILSNTQKKIRLDIQFPIDIHQGQLVTV